MPKYAKGIILKRIFFLKKSPDNLLISLYLLTMFEAPSYNSFLDIMISSYQYPN